MSNLDVARLEKQKKKKSKENEFIKREVEIGTQLKLGSAKHRKKLRKEKRTGSGLEVRGGTKAFIFSIIASTIFYMLFMNVPIQLPGSFILSDAPIMLPSFVNYLFTILFCAFVYAILSEVFQKE